CRRRRVSIVGKPIIAVVEVTARITEADQVACAMRDVSIVRKTVAENDDLSKCRRLRVNENWSRQKNGDAQKFCYSHDFPLLKNEIGMPLRMQCSHLASHQEHRCSAGPRERGRIASFPEPGESPQSWRSRARQRSTASNFHPPVPAARYVGSVRRRTRQSHSIESIRSDR